MKIFIILISIFIAGCQSVSIPKLPPVEGNIKIVSSAQVYKELTKYPDIKPPTLLDKKYIIMSDDYALKLIDGIAFIRKVLNFTYKSEANDCDNHAYLFKALVKYAFRYEKYEPLVFEVIHKMEHNWAGAPSGGYHDINVIATDKGFRMVEPNSNGTSCLLKDYPNKDYILQLL